MPSRRPHLCTSLTLFFAGTLLLGGCAVSRTGSQVSPVRPGAATGPQGEALKAPFYYQPLGVRNACFVESVHIYDLYRDRGLGGTDDSWVKVLQWGHRESDTKVGLGHAVAVFAFRGRLWTYDINHAFTQLAVPLERRGDLTDVTPEIFAKYPQQRPVLPVYRDDGHQHPIERIPEHLFYHANPDVREVTKVASELGRFRPVRVVEFKFAEEGVTRTSAAAAFLFGHRMCLYMPAKGTQIARPRVTTADDLGLLRLMLQQLFPGLTEVRWHPGGYWLFPPREKPAPAAASR
jgi:hypothetical protein